MWPVVITNPELRPPIAPVEAKRKHLDVSAALVQAKRYSRGFQPSGETLSHKQNWGTKNEFRLPFVFSSNGRPYLRQLATRSGIWFCDLRRPDNLGETLQGWYTPDGLSALLKRDEDAAHELLAAETFRNPPSLPQAPWRKWKRSWRICAAF